MKGILKRKNKMDYLWSKKEAIKNLEIFDKELDRLHKLLLAEVDYDLCKMDVENEITKIQNHMIQLSARFGGLEY